MPFSWIADPRAEAEGVVLAVDVSRHARSVGFESATLLSRGVWARFIGEGRGQERKLLDTLAAARAEMASPSQTTEDGTASTFALRVGSTSEAAIAIVDPARGLTLMLWREYTHRASDGSLRVRIVAEEEPRPTA